MGYATVITNNHIRPLVDWTDLPNEVKADFDYMEQREEDIYQTRFVKYLGVWYDVLDVQTIAVAPAHTPYGFNVHADHPLAGWAGIATTSHWSGTCFRWPTEDEVSQYDLYASEYDYIIVGRYVA